MVTNYTTKISLVLVWMMSSLSPMHAQGGKVLSKNEIDTIRGKFDLGVLEALDNNGDKDRARECFEEIIKSGVSCQARAWSYLWLTKIDLDEGFDVSENLNNAKSYKGACPFIFGILADFLSGEDHWVYEPNAFSGVVDAGSKSILGLLLEKEASLKCSYDLAPRQWADQLSNKGKVELFSTQGANRKATKNGSLPQLHGSSNGNYTELLYCWLLLHYVAAKGYEEIVGFLLTSGLNCESKDWVGETALHYAVKFGHKDVVELLLEKGADIDARNIYGRTPLIWAVIMGSKTVVQLLLEKGADCNGKDNFGESAVHWAVKNFNRSIFRLLLRAGADTNVVGNDGNTPLHFAAEHERKLLIQCLLARGADCNAQNERGETPLHKAFRKGQKGVAEILLKAGADSAIQDIDGKTALAYSSK